MTSKQALEDIIDEIKYTHNDGKTLTPFDKKRIDIIAKDLEILEILKKHFYEEYQLPTGQHSLLFRINGTPEYKKIKEWLENDGRS